MSVVFHGSKAKSFGGTASEAPVDLKVSPSGTLLLAGTTTGTFIMGRHTIAGMGTLFSWITSLDSEGDILAAKVRSSFSPGGPSPDRPYR